MTRLLSVSEAQERVLARVRALPGEAVSVAAAAGRVLAEDATARVDLPPFPSSAMDGFALRSSDVPGRLRIAGESAAGRPYEGVVGGGECVRISTGGVIPAGADAVIPVEYVVQSDNELTVEEDLETGAHVRPRGGDIRAGDVVVPRGRRLGAGAIGALAAAGIGEVVCARRPRVAVLATGTELVPPGEPLAPGQVYEANGTMLAAAIAAAGGDTELLSTVADTEDEHRHALERGLEADVLVTTGGVSVGEHDLVRRIEAELGVGEVFWRVAVKPGKPVSFGVRGPTLVFGLPGNPVSSLVGFELFVQPALLALQGATEPLPRFGSATLARRVRRNPARDEFLRARSRTGDGGVVVEPLDGQESHMIARASAADVLVLAPAGEGEIAAGETVRFLPIV
ncbi:MAG TPA: gephyrin-like molybdotransferase Glp [Candidatus Binatia bacterium]|nr:gephyrin-like molybdotransferase Glp [Candidatus Binatia bacterium]